MSTKEIDERIAAFAERVAELVDHGDTIGDAMEIAAAELRAAGGESK